MSDQKNKQQQPSQGNEKNQGEKSRPQGSQQSGSQHSAGQSSSQQQPHKGSMADTGREQPMGSDIENPDRDNEPGKTVNIDDDPEQTKKKVPNMG